VQGFVRDDNVEHAHRILKRRMQREGAFRELRRRRFYEKPSDRTIPQAGAQAGHSRQTDRRTNEEVQVIAQTGRRRG
jgi:small subunit ribosomal protein S21